MLMPKKILINLALFITIFLSLAPIFNPAFAASECDTMGVHIATKNNKVVFEQHESIDLSVTFDEKIKSSLDPRTQYSIVFIGQNDIATYWSHETKPPFLGDASALIDKTLTYTNIKPDNIQIYTLELRRPKSGFWEQTFSALSNGATVCKGPDIKVLPKNFASMTCSISIPKIVNFKDKLKIGVSYAPKGQGQNYFLYFYPAKVDASEFKMEQKEVFWGSHEFSVGLTGESEVDMPKLEKVGSDYTAVLTAYQVTNNYGAGSYFGCAVAHFKYSQDETSTDKSSSRPASGAGANETTAANQSGSLTIDGIQSTGSPKPCESSIKDSNGKVTYGIPTAIGCVPTNPTAFIQAFFKLSVGIGGGIAFLMMLYSAFEMIASAGNPESLKAGQQRFTSAIYGILFVVFAIFLLEVIGVDILGLEGFGR